MGKLRVTPRAWVTERQRQIRLSLEGVDRLIAAYAVGTRTSDLAREFGVHRNTVGVTSPPAV